MLRFECLEKVGTDLTEEEYFHFHLVEAEKLIGKEGLKLPKM